MGDRGSVLIITTAHQPTDVRIFRKQATSLAAQGFDMSLAAPDRGDARQMIEHAGVEFIALSPGVRRSDRVRRLRTVATMLWRRRKDFDAWHVHDPELLVLCAPLRLLIARRVRLVYDVHEDYAAAVLSREWIPRPLRRTVSLITRWTERLLSSTVTMIVAATPTIAAQFTASDRRAVLVNRNFPLQAADPASTARHPGVPARRPGVSRCVYIGGLTSVRGIREMVDAMRLLDDEAVELVMAGPYESAEFEAAVLAQAPASVTSLGPLPFEAMPALLHSSDIGLLCFLPEPNHVDSMPTKLFEYLDAGLAVVASDFDAWRPFVTDPDVGVQVDPTDASQIARGVRTLLDDPVRRADMGARGRRLARSSYTWEAEAATLGEAYASLFN